MAILIINIPLRHVHRQRDTLFNLRFTQYGLNMVKGKEVSKCPNNHHRDKYILKYRVHESFVRQSAILGYRRTYERIISQKLTTPPLRILLYAMFIDLLKFVYVHASVCTLCYNFCLQSRSEGNGFQIKTMTEHRELYAILTVP